MPITLWGRPSSLNVQKAMWALAECSLSYELVLASGILGPGSEQHNTASPFGVVDTREYLAMNPTGLVPTIKVGDTKLWESNTIVRYLVAELAPTAGIPSPTDPHSIVQLPQLRSCAKLCRLNRDGPRSGLAGKGAAGRARASLWMDWVVTSGLTSFPAPMINNTVRLPRTQRDPATFRAAHDGLVALLAIPEAELAKRPTGADPIRPHTGALPSHCALHIAAQFAALCSGFMLWLHALRRYALALFSGRLPRRDGFLRR